MGCLARTPSFTPLPGVTSLPTEEIDPTQCGAIAREYVARVRRDVRARHDAGAGGLAVVAAYTDAIDRLVGFLFTTASTRLPVALPAHQPALHGRRRRAATAAAS